MTLAVTVTDLAEEVVDAIQGLGPWVLLAVVAVAAASLTTVRGRAALRLAFNGLTGGRRSPLARVLSGLAIPLLAVTALTVSFALERELRNGPNRMVAIADGPGSSEASWLMQRDSSHFMNDSRLPVRLAAAARRTPGTRALWSQLSDVHRPGGERLTSLLIARTDGPSATTGTFAVRPGAPCGRSSGFCTIDPGTAVVDEGVAGVGETVELRGRPLRVVAWFRRPASLLNRAVIAVHPTTFDRTDGRREPPFAVIADTPVAGGGLRTLVSGSPEAGAVEFRTPAQIQMANRAFWAGNGTPILLLLVLMILAFAAVAYFAARRASQEQGRRQIATLLAIGVPAGTVANAEAQRAILSVAVAAAIGTPLAVIIVAVANGQILGFHAAVTVRMALAAMGAVVVVAVLTTTLLWWRLRRVDVAERLAAT